MIAKTEGIVLKSFDFRETSRIATFFTRDYGKVKGVLKGIRKDPRKFGSSVDRFSVNDIVYYQYRNSEIHLIGQCDMKDYFPGLRQDLKRMTAASYATELVDTVMATEQNNEEIYDLMQDFLRNLQTVGDISKLVHMLQIKILTLSGFKPHLDSCVRCSSDIRDRARFNLRLGGLVCVRCEDTPGEAVAISKGSVASILHVQQTPWAHAMRLVISEPMKKELKYVLNHFLVFHLEKHLRSARFLS